MVGGRGSPTPIGTQKGEIGVNQLFLHGWETVVTCLIHHVDEGLGISLGEASHIGRAHARGDFLDKARKVILGDWVADQALQGSLAGVENDRWSRGG